MKLEGFSFLPRRVPRRRWRGCNYGNKLWLEEH